MNNRFQICILSLLTLLSNSIYGQIPIVKTPQPANMLTVPTYTNPKNNTHTNIPSYPTQNRNKQLDIYEQDNRTIERSNIELNKTLQEYNQSKLDFQYDFPSQTNEKGVESYRKSAKLLNDMLSGITSISIKNAVLRCGERLF